MDTEAPTTIEELATWANQHPAMSLSGYGLQVLLLENIQQRRRQTMRSHEVTIDGHVYVPKENPRPPAPTHYKIGQHVNGGSFVDGRITMLARSSSVGYVIVTFPGVRLNRVYATDFEYIIRETDDLEVVSA